MPTMEWNVKNALNRDVERQHLNKILADIATSIASVSKTSGGSATGNVKDIVGEMVESNSESGISVTYDFVNKVLNFAVSSFTLRLAGDVTGQVSLSPGGGAVMTTTLDPSKIGIPDTTNDGYAYWRRYGVWEAVGSNLEAIQVLAADGFPACNYDATTETSTWAMRTITAGAGITVTDGDGVAGNPTIAHADTSSVANLTSDNSNLVVVQDVTFTFDTYGHVQTATVGTVDLGTSLITQTVTNGDTTHAPSGDAVFDYIAAGFQPLDADLTAIAALASTGFATRTAANTWAQRSFPDGTGFTWTNPAGVAGNPTLVLNANLQAWSAIATATKEPAITAGTDAQMWRGDKTFTNWINGDWRVGGSSGLFGSGRELVVTAGTAGDNIGHVSIQGSRTGSTTFAVVNFYHQANRVAAISGFRDGADDAGGFQIVTKATGVSTAVAMEVGGDRHWLPGTTAVQNIGSSSLRMASIFAGNGDFSNGAVIGTVSNPISFTPTLRVEFQDTVAVPSGTFIRYGANANAPFILGYKARGTAGAPTQTLSGDGLMNIRGGGWHSGGAFGNTQAAVIEFNAAENFTSTAQGTKMLFRVTVNGTATPTTRLTIDENGDVFLSGGRLYGTALHNHASGLAGTTNQYVGSGTYTPTYTGVANVAATTAAVAQWMRVGNVVTVSARVNIQTTAAAGTLTQLRMTLPIASALTGAQQASGSGGRVSAAAVEPVSIAADAASDEALLSFFSTATANVGTTIQFTYLVL